MIKRIKYYLFLVCMILLLAPKPVIAQRYDEGYGRHHTNHHYDDNYNSSDDSAIKYNLPTNDCSKYYFRNTDTLNHIYNKVTISTYACDSNLNLGDNLLKEVITYNAKGEELKDITKAGKRVVAKVKMKYDKNFRWTSEINYDTTDRGTLFKSEIMKKAYNSKGLKTLDYDKDRSGLDFFTWDFWHWDWDMFDPTIEITAEKWKYDNKDRITMHYTLDNERVFFINNRDISRELSQYDSLNDVTSFIRYHRDGWLDGGDKDTNFTFSGYNKAGQITYEIYKANYGNVTRSYYKYDSKGNEIFNATTGYDSIANINQYDSTGRFSGTQKYRNGKLTDSYTVRFDKNRNRIENEEKISTATENSCANNIVTTTVTDSNGFEI